MKKIFLLSFALLLSVVLNGQGVFAEDDLLCTGRIKGDTSVAVAKWNPNTGITTFNDAGDNVLVDLSVMGAGMGYAPSRGHAGCTISGEKEEYMNLAEDEFGVKGYAWNTNIGFISMYCDGAGAPYSNLGINCGDFKYGVKIGADGSSGVGAGNRPLWGYAYSDVFGYINFGCRGGRDIDNNDCGPIEYGVTRASDGTLTGHAYTSAGVYMVFDGVNMGLPGDIVEDSYCAGRPYVCMEIRPDPRITTVDYTGGFKLADGSDGYTVHIFLKDKNGVYDSTLYDEEAFFQSLDFDWEDKVKLDQVNGKPVGDTLAKISSPFISGLGGVLYKPVSGLTINDFTAVSSVPDRFGFSRKTGEFILKTPITSFTPTFDGNVSRTSSLNVPILVKNEYFMYNYEKAPKPTEHNVLNLKNLKFELKDKDGNPVVIPASPNMVYANGTPSIPFKFRPVWDLETLYVNDRQDKIVGYRGIPVSFTLMAKLAGSIPFSNPVVDFILDYDATETNMLCGEGAKFDFHFLSDVEGEELGRECVECNDPKEDLPCDKTLCANYSSSQSLENQSLLTLEDQNVNLSAVAMIEGDVPCNMAEGPGFVSVVRYTVPRSKENPVPRNISYYANKLPRLAGALISNPAAMVQGNVYAQTSFSPSAETETGQVLSTVNIDIVQDTISQNLAKAFVNKKIPQGNGGECVLDSLDEEGISCITGGAFAPFTVNNEKVLYFNNTDVVLASKSGIIWDGLTVIVVDGGNLYIDADLYNETTFGNRLSIVVLRGYEDSVASAGNIYIAPNVQNIQANIVASGSIFSYKGDRSTDINKTTGEPIWANNDERISTLSKQIFIQGSISSRNTIGGADLDSPRAMSKPRPYLLLGTGEVIQNPSGEDRVRAQLYDLNYLRLFRMVIETDPLGFPIDQQCAKGLTPDDIMAIYNGLPVFGPTGNLCNGIDPLNPVAFNGDLVVPKDEGLLAKGIPQDAKLSPVYVFYVAPSSESFVFSRPGTMNISR